MSVTARMINLLEAMRRVRAPLETMPSKGGRMHVGKGKGGTRTEPSLRSSTRKMYKVADPRSTKGAHATDSLAWAKHLQRLDPKSKIYGKTGNAGIQQARNKHAWKVAK